MAIFPNLYIPDERDLRFASTGSKSGNFDLNSNKNYHFSKVSQPYARY